MLDRLAAAFRADDPGVATVAPAMGAMAAQVPSPPKNSSTTT
jgi:hypothetical protein